MMCLLGVSDKYDITVTFNRFDLNETTLVFNNQSVTPTSNKLVGTGTFTLEIDLATTNFHATVSHQDCIIGVTHVGSSIMPGVGDTF